MQAQSNEDGKCLSKDGIAMTERERDIDHEAMDWVVKQSSGKLDAEDQRAFEQWLNADRRHEGAFLRGKALWLRLDDANVMSPLNSSADASAVKDPDNLPGIVAKKSLRLPRRMVLGGLAAAGVAALAFLKFYPKSGELLETGPHEFRKVLLPDQSVASLNSSSVVEVRMTDELRRIDVLAGEAWFDVTKNPARPFLVEAGRARVKAVGTSFSVKRVKDGVDVVVSEGVVDIWNDQAAAAKRRASAGDIAFVPSEPTPIHILTSPKEVARKLAWRDGNIILDNEPLNEAVTAFNQANARQIIIIDPALNGARFYGVYQLDQPENFARDVHALLKVPVMVSDDKIYIGKMVHNSL